ncbi:MAG: glycosyltransferase family 2 protein [Prevotella sp.]|nr:glycosyltransferase family 2 protein [Prevotella sp.]
MNEESRISVVINTYNAEQHLAACLEAVKDFDEVVVCDMESTDRTVEIAREHGARVVTFPKADHKSAEPARTFAIQSAQSKWVLVVDSDEIITPELRQYLYQRVSQPGCPAGLYIARRNKLFGQYNRDWSHDYQLRFFIREGTVWPPYVHTFPQVQGDTERAPEKYQMLHLADETMQQWVRKMNEYTDNEVEKKAERNYGVVALFWRPFWRFFSIYVLKGGFRNGRRGLLQAVQWAMYQQVLVSKIIEKRLREKEK